MLRQTKVIDFQLNLASVRKELVFSKGLILVPFTLLKTLLVFHNKSNFLDGNVQQKLRHTLFNHDFYIFKGTENIIFDGLYVIVKEELLRLDIGDKEEMKMRSRSFKKIS